MPGVTLGNAMALEVAANLPFYRKLGQHIRRANQQLDAENPAHDKPNIMVFISHRRRSSART